MAVLSAQDVERLQPGKIFQTAVWSDRAGRGYQVRFFGVRQTDALRLNHNFALFVEFADGVFEGIFTAMKRCVNGARMQRIKGR